MIFMLVCLMICCYRTLENKLTNHSSAPSPSLSSILLLFSSAASFLTDVSSSADMLSKLCFSHFKLSISPKGWMGSVDFIMKSSFVFLWIFFIGGVITYIFFEDVSRATNGNCIPVSLSVLFSSSSASLFLFRRVSMALSLSWAYFSFFFFSSRAFSLDFNFILRDSCSY